MRRSKLDILLNFKRTGQGAKDSTKELKDLSAVTKQAGVSAKGFDLIQIGLAGAISAVTVASIKQLPEMFDLGFSYRNAQIALAAYSGSAAEAEELTEAVTEAAGGAIDQMTAMQNATRLLSLGLAENAETAAELTDIAITLGATMGKDAKGAFEEFTLLLANQSILRLDTFGISAGLVRQRMEELADEMPNADRQTRFLNATLEIARGRMEELDKAGFEATSSLDKLRAESVDLRNELSLKLFTGLEFWIELLADVVQGTDPVIEAVREQTRAILETNPTLEVLTFEMQRLADITPLTAAEITAIANEEIFAAETARIMANATDGLSASEARLAGITREVAEDAEEATEELSEMGDEVGEVSEEFKSFFADIDRGLASTVQGFIKDLQFLAAGGGELEIIGQQINDALSSGKITPAQADEMFDELFVRIQLLEVDLGNITAFQAAKNIRDTLGVSLAEAFETVKNVQAGLSAIDGTRITAEMLLSIILTGTPFGQFGPGGPSAPGQPNDPAPPGGGGGSRGGGGGKGTATTSDVAAFAGPAVSIGTINVGDEVDLAMLQNMLEGVRRA